MSDSPMRMQADYTRGGPAPVGGWSWLLAGPVTLKRALVILGITGVLIAALLPLDGTISHFAVRTQEGGDLKLGGDLRRELVFIQQWGDLVCLALVFGACHLLDRARRRAITDALAAVGFNALIYQCLKLVIGRPRPHFDDPTTFLGPFHAYPLVRDGETVMRHSWEVWGRISSDLASMPSGHTAAATGLSVVLSRLYPRLAPLVLPLAVVVGVCRVIFVAHYPTDVVAGLCVGYLGCSIAMDKCWGSRLAARLGAMPTQEKGK